MKLSELLFNCIKETKQLPDLNFTYEAFIAGDFDNDVDYVNSINNAFNPLNRAIHRLSDRGKLPFKTNLINYPHYSNVIDLQSASANPLRIKSITNVVYFCPNGKYVNIHFRDLGDHKIALLDYVSPDTPLLIEYIEDVPNFKRTDFDYSDEDETKHYDVDLMQYGINETMCSYIEEYVKGFLFEIIDPQIANLHRTYAEQCFDDLEEHGTAFYQSVVKPIYRV